MGIFLRASKISKTSDSEGYRRERVVTELSNGLHRLHFYQALTGAELIAVERDFFNSWMSPRVDVIAPRQSSEQRAVLQLICTEISRADMEISLPKQFRPEIS